MSPDPARPDEPPDPGPPEVPPDPAAPDAPPGPGPPEVPPDPAAPEVPLPPIEVPLPPMFQAGAQVTVVGAPQKGYIPRLAFGFPKGVVQEFNVATRTYTVLRANIGRPQTRIPEWAVVAQDHRQERVHVCSLRPRVARQPGRQRARVPGCCPCANDESI